MFYSGRGFTSLSIKLRCLHWASHCSMLAWTTPAHIRDAVAAEELKLTNRRYRDICRWLGGGKWLNYESTTLGNLPCWITGQKTKGVQANLPCKRIDSYPGKVYRVALNSYFRERIPEDSWSLTTRMLLAKLGTPYDGAGCAVCGSLFLKRLLPADTASFFCSELGGFRDQVLGLMPVENLGMLSPAAWYRWGVRSGVTGRAEFVGGRRNGKEG